MSLLKRIITVILTVSIIATVSSFAVSAWNDGSVQEQQSMLGCDIPEEDSLPDTDELLMGYLEKDIYPSFSTFGRSAYDMLNDNEKILYNQIKAGIVKIAEGKTTSTAIEITSGLDGFSWTKAELGVSSIVSGGEITSAAETAITNAIQSTITTGDIMRALMSDIPCELFWFDKTEGMQPAYASSAERDGSRAYISKFVFKFKVSPDFAGNLDYTTNSAKISAISTAKQTANSIVASNANKTDIEKLTAYKEEICHLTDYYDGDLGASYGNPWQLVWVFDDDSETNVVCEGYSKAFKYLCDLSTFSSNVYCYIVTGEMQTSSISGPHMWNLVEIGGKNYLVDITNSDDGSIGDDGSLFMAGTTSSDGGAVNKILKKYQYSNQTYVVATYVYDTINIGNYLEDGVFLPVSQTSYQYDSVRVLSVTVNGGNGSGEYSVGATVTVTANPPEQNQMFERWVVNAGSITLDDPLSETATFTMPNQTVTVTATYHTHTYANNPSYDEDEHWYEYTCGCNQYLPDTHSFKQTVTLEATCAEFGEIKYACDCGYSYTEPTEKLEHEYDDGVVVKEPTVEEYGVKEFTCIECGETNLRTLPRLEPEEIPNENGTENNVPATPNESDPTDNDIGSGGANGSNADADSTPNYEDSEDNGYVYDDGDIGFLPSYGCEASVSTAALTVICILGAAITSKRKHE